MRAPSIEKIEFKTYYSEQKMLSQILFFKTKCLSTATKSTQKDLKKSILIIR